jgi:hypothetical protein
MGNRNVERILLFLFVNEKCYGTQIQMLLQVPLTPVQKALERLEKGGIIQSHFEGKIRIYQFRSDYPLRSELEMLLKKAYSLLPVQEKKGYCFIHQPKVKLDARDLGARSELQAFWEKLSQVKRLHFSAKSKHKEDRVIKTGKATVVIAETPTTLVFQEKGTWIVDDLPGPAFTNSFRWSLDINRGLIALEHLRYGPNHPVFLFHLAPKQSGVLEAVDSHLCAEDAYLGNITWSGKSIRFHWRIIGPRKNDELLYLYES